MTKKTKKRNSRLFTDIVVSGFQTNDAAIVTVVLEDSFNDDVLRGYGTSKRAPGDRYMGPIGANLALARALKDLAETLEQDAQFCIEINGLPDEEELDGEHR